MQVNQCKDNALQSATLVLSGASGGIVADPTTVVDVVGDNNLVATPGLYIRGNTVDTTAGVAQVPVLLGGPAGATSASTVTVKYTTENGSAVSGTDYSTTSGMLTFGPGQTEQTISVPIINRTTAAASRSFTVVLSTPSNAAIVQSTATVTIGASKGTPASSPYIYAPPNTVIGEADGWVDLPVTLGAPSSNLVTVNWTVPSGGCDYPLSGTGANGTESNGASGSGTLSFVPGQVLQVIRMQVNQCNDKAMQSATLTLSQAVDGIIETATSLITVTPPPAAPTTSVLIPASGATLSGTSATLDASASNATSVEFWILGGSYGYSGKMIGTATSSSYGWLYSWNTTTVPNGSYALLSEAFNSTTSALSAPISITVSNPPTTSVLIPASGATLSGTSATLDASASNATSVEFWILGGSYGYSGKMIGTATSSSYGWLYSWNTTTVPNGPYALLSEAFNSTTSALSAPISITVSNPPTTSVLIPASGATLSGTSATLDASASNATSVEFWILGGSYGYSGKMIGTATSSSYGWLYSWNTTTVPNGSYALLSEAFNSTTSALSAPVSITVENTT